MKINATTKDVIMDTTSSVTIIPPDKKRKKKLWPINNRYPDVKKNERKSLGKITVKTENKGIGNWKFLLPREKTSRRYSVWIACENLAGWKNIKHATNGTDQSERRKISKFEKIIQTNREQWKIPRSQINWHRDTLHKNKRLDQHRITYKNT